MRSPIACAVVMLGLTVQAGLAMDPDEAGRQARSELKALLDKQQSDKGRVEQTADNAVPPRPSKADDGRALKSVSGRVPTICSGC